MEKECNLQSKPKVGNCVKFFERKKISLVIQYFGGYEREFNYLRKLRTKASSILRKIYYLRSCLIDNTIDSLFFFQQFLLQHERVRTQLMIWAYFLSHSLPLSSHVALWLRVINFVPFIRYFQPRLRAQRQNHFMKEWWSCAAAFLFVTFRLYLQFRKQGFNSFVTDVAWFKWIGNCSFLLD